MKNGISSGIAVMAVAMIAIGAAAPEAFGQNMQVSNLTLKKTYVVTHTTQTFIYGQNFASLLFAPSGTIVNCPKGANCFLKVDVTLQASVSPGESLFLYGRVDYDDSAPQVAQVISGVPNGISETRSYSWFFEVPQGDHGNAWTSLPGPSTISARRWSGVRSRFPFSSNVRGRRSTRRGRACKRRASIAVLEKFLLAGRRIVASASGEPLDSLLLESAGTFSMVRYD